MSNRSVAGIAGARTVKIEGRLAGVTAGSSGKPAKLLRGVTHFESDFSGEPRGPRRRGGRASGNIGVISMGAPVSALCRRPLMTAMIRAIEAEAAAHDLKVVLASIDEDNQVPHSILGGRLDGLLLVSCCHTLQRGVVETLLRFPCVWMLSNHNDDRREFDRISCSNDTVAWLATQYLIDRGHKHVAFVNSSPSHMAFQMRRQVFADHVRSAGLKLSEYVAPLGGSFQPDILHHDRLMAALCEAPDRPTGIFVPTDMQVPATYAVMQRYGLRPGTDIDVIGVDNMDAILDTLSPRPASIDINLELVGCRAVRQMLWRRDHMAERNRMSVVIEPRLILPSPEQSGGRPSAGHEVSTNPLAAQV